MWEAKVRRGGNFTNSRFEELTDPDAISQRVADITQCRRPAKENFGLTAMAKFSTVRRSWVADDDFTIVEDTTDFGHTVGEVELVQEHIFTENQIVSVEKRKERMVQEMDDRIIKFMARYSWAFQPGAPKGKLVAYFEQNGRNSMFS
jgi:thiamine-triphosphatase